MEPIHIALTMHSIATNYGKSFEKLYMIIEYILEKNIPILSIHLIPDAKTPYNKEITTAINTFLSEIEMCAKENQMKINVYGKWYDIEDIIEQTKRTITATKDNERSFLNLFLNYSGKEEILDSCKLIGRKVKTGKLDPENLTESTIKENLYTHNTIPPQLIIQNGKRIISDFMMWECVNIPVYFTDKSFDDMNFEDIDIAISLNS